MSRPALLLPRADAVVPDGAQMMHRWAGLAVAIAAFLLYLTTPSQKYSADSLLYAVEIESERSSGLLVIGRRDNPDTAGMKIWGIHLEIA